jgi:serine/threonine-protein kinase haspin
MSQRTSVRTYGKRARKPQPGKALAELDVNVSMSTTTSKSTAPDDTITKITKKLKDVTIHDGPKAKTKAKAKAALPATEPEPEPDTLLPQTPRRPHRLEKPSLDLTPLDIQEDSNSLTWEDVCPVGDRIEKIAEASYAEVYRITNDRGTSIIKVIRLESPIKPQTKAQQKSGLVDEEPHSEDDLAGELQISELLADIPGFVIYKEKYTVQGKTTPALLETHQTFHKKMKRKDPGRLQFYPSPSRYLNETEFLVVELGDAGTALEDLEIVSVDQIWDIFLHVAVALARAENLVRFEVRPPVNWPCKFMCVALTWRPSSTATCTKATCVFARSGAQRPRRTSPRAALDTRAWT